MHRTKATDLKQELKKSPSAFSFIQALRLLKFFHGKKTDLPEFVKKYLRVTPVLSLGFPGCDVKDIIFDEDKELFKITATFLGLYGPSSPLPVFYTEELIDEKNEDRSVKKDFLDIFNIVFFELFYSCISKYSPALKFCDENNKEYKNSLYSILGLGSYETRKSFTMKDEMLRYLGIFTTWPRSVSGLETIIKDYFSLENVKINEFIKSFVTIPDEQKTVLGERNSTLGNDCHLGTKIEDYSGKFQIEIINLPEDDFHRFIPSGDKFMKLEKITSFYLDQPLEAGIQLSPLCEDIKPACPGSSKWSELGYNTWIFSKGFKPENKTADFMLDL